MSLDHMKAPRLAPAPAPRPTPKLSPQPQISVGTILLLAATCGLIVANIYYAQPLIGPIAQTLGLAPQAAGLIVTMSQIGYGAGLLFIVPLGDLVENRRLTLASVGLSAIALAAAAFAPSASIFLICAGLIGLGSVAVQILVPLAAHLAPEATRGRVVGMVSSGLMIGIMLARPVSSFIAAQSSWRAVFVLSSAAMVALAAVLSRALPVRAPQTRMTYGALIGSMAHLAAATPLLRRRAFYQSCLFFAFSLFWTTTPLLLAGPHYRMTQNGIALFGLAGVSGAIAAPIAGRLADRGFSRPTTGAAIVLVAAGLPLTLLAAPGSPLALALLVAAAIAIDFGVQGNLVLGFRAIFALAPDARGRLNGAYIATFFAAGAVGSAVGAWAYARGGWTLACWVGVAPPLLALARFLLIAATRD
jgi:predicted MFS family arabinose efflux permease